MPASASQAITLVAYPVIVVAAIFAQSGESAVTITRAAVIGNASAKVSAMKPFVAIAADSGIVCPIVAPLGQAFRSRIRQSQRSADGGEN
jgi:hypothetical protein